MSLLTDTQALLPEPLRSQRVAQIGVLVPDLPAAVRIWSVILGLDDWLVFTYGPDNTSELTFRGQPGVFSMRMAIVGDSPQIELIEPLIGPSLYHEWVQQHGYGLHHLGFVVPSIAAAKAEVTAHGVDVLQSGSGYGVAGDGGFAYFDTESIVGVICEAMEVPVQRRPSERLS